MANRLYLMCVSLSADYNDDIQRLAFVQYSFDRHEHSIAIRPHGNSKNEQNAFRRTKPSTIKLMKDLVAESIERGRE